MRRVLFLTESFHPILGGGETHIRELAGRLVATGMRATVLTRRSEAAWPAEEEIDGVRVLRVAPSGPARRGKYLMLPAAMARLARETGRYDVVVARGTRVLGLPALLAARALGKAVVLQPELNGEMTGEVYTFGTPLHGGAWGRAVRAATSLRNLWLRDADAFVAMSRAIAREFAEAGVRADRIAHIPHGVDTRRFRPAEPSERRSLRARLNLAEDAEWVVYAGRLLRGKGLETLLEAFQEVAGSRPRARLLLVGSGSGQAISIEDELRQRVVQSSLASRVVFTGRVDGVSPYLRAADVFVLPSIYEALGLALVEAAACGLPVVATRTGGIVDVVGHGTSGWLVTPGATLELTEALADLLARPDRRAAFGAGGRLIATRDFDIEDSVDRYRALFSELDRSKGGAGE